MDDNDSLDRTLSDLIGSSSPTIADEDGALRLIVHRARGRVRHRRLVASAATMALVASVAIAVVVAGQRSDQVRVQGHPVPRIVPPMSTSTTTTTAPLDPPVLGHAWAPSQHGFGEVRPTSIFLGGDPTGLVDDVTWQSWGQMQAVGHGTGNYLAPGKISADAVPEPATVVAFNPGSCRGTRSYLALAWFYPQHGETFDGTNYINICTGDFVGVPGSALLLGSSLDLAKGTAFGIAPGNGVTPEAVLDSLTPVLGPPTRDTGWYITESRSNEDCLGNMRQRVLRWGNLSFAFWNQESPALTILWSWALGQTADQREPQPVVDTPPVAATTSDGVGLGTPFAEVQARYGARVQEADQKTIFMETGRGGSIMFSIADGNVSGIQSRLSFC